MIENFFYEPAILHLFTLPILTTIFSIIFQIIIKDKYIVSGVCLIVYLFLTLIVFDDPFVAWAILYTMLSFTVSLILELVGIEKSKVEE